MSKFHFLTNKKNQRGLTIIESGIVLLVIALFILGTVKGAPELFFMLKKSELKTEVVEIRNAAQAWKGMKPTFTGIAIPTLCSTTRKALNENTCGSSSDGKTANPFGGDYTLAVGANKSQVVLDITAVDADRIDELADELAPLTADRCVAFDGCATISVTGSSIAMTF